MDWALLKKFKNQMHLIRNAVGDMAHSNISFGLNIDREKGGNCSLKLPPEREISRFAAVLRPLADSISPLYFKKIASALLENDFVSLSASDKEELLKHVKLVEDGPMRFKINNDALTASGLYSLYARGEYFSESTDEAAKIFEYKKAPIANQFILFNFYSYCCDVYRISRYLYDLIKQAENKLSKSEIIKAGDKENYECIYCRSRINDFNCEEHVYPESLGNTDIILPPGCVCDPCNNGVLSELDNYLVNHDVISMLRVLYVPYNPKTGKFPVARYQNMTIEKTHPRKINLNVHGNAAKSIKVKTEGDLSHITLNTVGRSKFKPRLLGRSLYKIALGIVCWQHGPDVALDKKYNTAREFILDKRSFPNNLLVGSEFKPCEYIEGEHYILKSGTVFGISIFGLPFLFNLEPAPLIEMNSEFDKLNAKLFSLSC